MVWTGIRCVPVIMIIAQYSFGNTHIVIYPIGMIFIFYDFIIFPMIFYCLINSKV